MIITSTYDSIYIFYYRIKHETKFAKKKKHIFLCRRNFFFLNNIRLEKLVRNGILRPIHQIELNFYTFHVTFYQSIIA